MEVRLNALNQGFLAGILSRLSQCVENKDAMGLKLAGKDIAESPLPVEIKAPLLKHAKRLEKVIRWTL